MAAGLKLFGLIVALLLVLGGGAAVVYWTYRWFRQSQEPPDDPGAHLSKFRELHRRGELTDEEFEAVRRRLHEQIREAMLNEDDPNSMS